MADQKDFVRHHAKLRGVHVIVVSLRPAPRVFMEPVTFIEPVCTAPLQGASAHARVYTGRLHRDHRISAQGCTTQ